MPRLYVNAMTDLSIQGGLASFTLQDRSAGPEDIVSVVMREAEFASMIEGCVTALRERREHREQKLGGGAGLGAER